MEKGIRVVNQKEQFVIIFTHNEFPDIELYAVNRYFSIEEEGPPSEFFNDERTGDTVAGAVNINNNEDVVEEDTLISEAIRQIDNLRVGGEVEASDLHNAGLAVDNDNDPLPENLPSRRSTTNTESECTYQEWGHSGICHRRNVVNNNTLPQLKVANHSNFNRVQLFELLFTTKYIKEVIVPNINKNITGERVTYGEFLRWLGLWFLISSVIGPSRDSFFLNQICNEVSEAPFRVSQYMSRR